MKLINWVKMHTFSFVSLLNDLDPPSGSVELDVSQYFLLGNLTRRDVIFILMSLSDSETCKHTLYMDFWYTNVMRVPKSTM